MIAPPPPHPTSSSASSLPTSYRDAPRSLPRRLLSKSPLAASPPGEVAVLGRTRSVGGGDVDGGGGGADESLDGLAWLVNAEVVLDVVNAMASRKTTDAAVVEPAMSPPSCLSLSPAACPLLVLHAPPWSPRQAPNAALALRSTSSMVGAC